MILDYGRTQLYQWDINQRLIVDNPLITEVHYANAATAKALICEVYEEDGKRVANIPNILLQESWALRVYGCCAECVRAEETFQIIARDKPDDYVYTETEIRDYSNLQAGLAITRRDVKNLETRVNDLDEGKFELLYEDTYGASNTAKAYQKNGLCLKSAYLFADIPPMSGAYNYNLTITLNDKTQYYSYVSGATSTTTNKHTRAMMELHNSGKRSLIAETVAPSGTRTDAINARTITQVANNDGVYITEVYFGNVTYAFPEGTVIQLWGVLA